MNDDLIHAAREWLEGIHCASGNGSRAPVNQLLTEGVPEGEPQDDTLYKLVFQLRAAGVGKGAVRAAYRAAAGMTKLKDESWPFTIQDFERNWRSAAKEQGDVPPVDPEQRRDIAALSEGLDVPKPEGGDESADDGEAEKTTGKSRPAPLEEVSLAAMVRDGVPDPELLCGGLLYAGGLHCISGPPDCGKTSLVLWWALQVARKGGAVLLLDEEGGAGITADKLRSLGAEENDVRNIHYVPFPALRWKGDDFLRLSATMRAVRPELIIWDSSAAFLAIAGLDENNAADVTKFWSDWLAPCARQIGAAVVVIDHDAKSTEPSRYARGSGAKLAMTDVMFKLEATVPFTRDSDGTLKMKITKDRRGYLSRAWDIEVKVNAGVRFVFTESGDELAGFSERDRNLLSVLTHQEQSTSEVTALYCKTYENIDRRQVSRALDRLNRADLSSKRLAPGGKTAFWLLTDAGQVSRA